MLSLEQWQEREYTGLRLGLGRIKAFLARAGDPERQYPVIHVAGTNGKGSTACMTASILSRAGYRTGLYTSPHLLDLSERISIDGEPISRASMEALVARHERDAESCKLTFFEFVTGIALLYFARRAIDVAVLETGLGGRYDATNVIAKPMVSVITEIGRDHQRILGKTVEAIAGEKAGIIKKGSPVVTGVTSPAALRVILRAAKAKNVSLYRLGKDFTGRALGTDWQNGSQRFVYRGPTAAGSSGGNEIECSMPFLGDHQVRNACLAAATAGLLGTRGWHIAPEHIRDGLRRARWPGRFDVRRISRGGRDHIMVVDGAHNPQAAASFVRTWRRSPWGRRRQPFMFGVLRDKDYRAIIKLLAPLMSEAVLVTIPSTRALPAEEMAVLFRRYRGIGRIAIASSIGEAAAQMQKKPVAAVVGSLYLAGEILKYSK